MKDKELRRLLDAAELRNPGQFNASRERYLTEISFKAGIKEVVDFLREHTFSKEDWGYDPMRVGDVLVESEKMQEKLKEWGVSQ